MLYIIFQDIMSEEEASQKLGRKVIEYTSQEFETKRSGDVVRFENEEAYQYITEKGYY